MLGIIQNRLSAITFRWAICAAMALGFAAFIARALAADSSSITGVYNGSYTGDQGDTKFKLTITQQDNGTITGKCTIFPPDNSAPDGYTCAITGRYIPASKMIQISRGRWESAPPSNITLTGLNGVFDPTAADGAGQISGTVRARPAPKFQATRDPAESAALASATPEKKETPTPSPAAPAASPASPAQYKAANALTAADIDGVYTGNYSTVDGSVKAKLSVKSAPDGTITGVFTFDLPAWAGARPATYKLSGKFVAGARAPYQLTTVEPVGTPPPANYAFTAFNGVFGVGQYVKGTDGLLHDGVNLDHLHGSTPGKASVGFEGTRDKTASADLDAVMAAQANAALGATTTPSTPQIARLHSIDGVYNGTFAGKQGGQIKFKIIITQTGGGKLGGIVTVYLPSASGETPYSYNVDGVNDPMHHQWELYAREWDSVPPKDFEATGFSGNFIANVAKNSARIYGPARFGPKFDATWSDTESVDLAAAIDNQKYIGTSIKPRPTAQDLAAQAAAHDAAVKAHDDAVAHAPPKELASKDLVRKSWTYWQDYQDDMTREVFDGGFGEDIDQNEMFEELFCTYVDHFSAKCRDQLPPQHETVVITRYQSSKDAFGNYVAVPVQSWSVEVDSRFAQKYRQFINALGSPAIGLRAAITVAAGNLTPQDIVNELMAPTEDMDRFFATEKPTSAAMHQLTENFFRAINKKPSLQQANEKIPGAAAETDKDLPPGRYARFIDGANAFYRDPANAKYAGKNDTAFCQALAIRYEFKLTREEEYYYANDFKARFVDQIMQPQDKCADPEWPVLHPVVETCIAEFR